MDGYKPCFGRQPERSPALQAAGYNTVHHGELNYGTMGLIVCSLSAASEREIVPDAIEKPNYSDLSYDTKLKSTYED